MARLPRLAVPNELHYVLKRGHNRQPVFMDDQDRQAYLTSLREQAAVLQLPIHAYALLDDEVRLLVTPSDAGVLSKAMQGVGRRYVASFNRRHRRSGTLWEGRFRAALLDSEHFLAAVLHVETAPVRAGLAVTADGWHWSSAAHHLGHRRDPLITDHRLFWQLGNTPFDREAAYRAALEQGVSSNLAAAFDEAAVKCRVHGSSAFVERMSERTSRPLSPRPRGRPPKTPS